jgi:hypothetical protein
MSKPMVKRRYILPRHDTWAQAVRQVQRVYQDEARLSPVILHAHREPFDDADDTFKVAEIIFDSESSSVFGGCQRAEGVRLTEMSNGSRLPDRSGVDVAADESINQCGLANAGYAFDEQRIEWRYRICSHNYSSLEDESMLKRAQVCVDLISFSPQALACSRLFSFPKNFCRNLATLGATTIWQ